jgi:N-ethylmaleimide reductase
MQSDKKILLEGIQLGDLVLKNRFVLAPLTRCRGDIETGVPSDIMIQYY